MSAAKREGEDRSNGRGRGLWRVAVYYLFGAILVLVVVTLVPEVREVFTVQPVSDLDFADEITQTMQGMGFDVTAEGWGVLVAALSMLGALLIMIPVALIYIIIKRRGGYDQSVVHTLMILPVAVTGIVMIVKTSLPLAFSLAGIVAAVRFRTTLEDTKDAVYVFLGIGVGLAMGVQALGVAVVLSIVFNVVNLILWRMNFGNIYVDQHKRTGALALGDVLAGPSSANTAVSFGDKRLLEALSPGGLQDVAERVAHMQRHLADETDVKKERRLYGVLLIHTDQVGEAQKIAERHLQVMAIRWRLAEIVPGGEGVSVLEYLVRTRPGVPSGALLDAIRDEGGDLIRAAEIRSLAGMGRS